MNIRWEIFNVVETAQKCFEAVRRIRKKILLSFPKSYVLLWNCESDWSPFCPMQIYPLMVFFLPWSGSSKEGVCLKF